VEVVAVSVEMLRATPSTEPAKIWDIFRKCEYIRSLDWISLIIIPKLPSDGERLAFEFNLYHFMSRRVGGVPVRPVRFCLSERVSEPESLNGSPQ
jgi:hypothetical protein